MMPLSIVCYSICMRIGILNPLVSLPLFPSSSLNFFSCLIVLSNCVAKHTNTPLPVPVPPPRPLWHAMRRLCDLFARGEWGEVLWHKLFSVSRNLSVNIYKIFLKYVPQSWKSIGNTRHARHMMLQAARGRGRGDLLSNEQRKLPRDADGGGRWRGGSGHNIGEPIRLLSFDSCATHALYKSAQHPHTPHPPSLHGIGRLFGQSIKQVAEIPLTPLSAPCYGPAWPGKNMSAAGEKHSN